MDQPPKWGGVHHQPGKTAQHLLHAARMREIVAVVAAVHDHREASLRHFQYGHDAGVVHVHLLRIRVQFQPHQPQRKRPLDFRLGVREILMEGEKAGELGMRGALGGDEIVDGGNLVGAEGHRMHHLALDGRTGAYRQQRLARSVGHIHGDVVKAPHALNRLLFDGVGVNMAMDINNRAHGKPFIAQGFSPTP